MTSKPLLSVIIPVYNEQQHILNCLDSLCKQSYRPFEIIVVDDGSTDQTLAKLHRFSQIHPTQHVTILTQPHSGPGTARNLAAANSRGDILVFVDADMTLTPNFLEQLTLPIRLGKSIGTFTTVELVSNLHNPWAKSWSLIRGWSDGGMHSSRPPNTSPVFRAILTHKFKQAQGYNTLQGYDDDWSLSARLGVQASNAPKATIYHANPDSMQDIFTQAQWVATRRYKLGFLGKIIALIRASLPISFLLALILALKHQYPPLLPAKLVYDLGITLGILNNVLKGKTAR